MTTQKQTTISAFSGLGIAPRLLDTLLELGFTTPTPIQAQAIPVALSGKDLAGIAQTGTGKTLAFGIPMIERLVETKGRGLVILPTRELALQVDESLKRLAGSIGLRTAVLIGGASMANQTHALAKNPHVIIATPGRLIDHMESHRVILSDVRVLVLDEADRMLDMGFAPQIEKILRALPSERQTMLFSATMPPGIMKIASRFMKMPVRIEVAPTGTTAERVTQELFVIKKDQKRRLLEKLLVDYAGTTLVFTRTRHEARRLARIVRAMGHSTAEIHSDRSLPQRREALEGFKTGKYRVLIATDIASRGIDVVGIGLVVNYDVPTNPEDYVHRIGRTARAGAGGHAITFVIPEQRGEIERIEKLTRMYLPISPVPELPPDRPLPFMPEHQPRRQGGGRTFAPRIHGADSGERRRTTHGTSFQQTRRPHRR